jgi:hypothetical protein
LTVTWRPGSLSGWPVAGIATTLAVLAGPAALDGTARRQHETDTAQAVATCADMIRDTMASLVKEELTMEAQVSQREWLVAVGRVQVRLMSEGAQRPLPRAAVASPGTEGVPDQGGVEWFVVGGAHRQHRVVVALDLAGSLVEERQDSQATRQGVRPRIT